MLYVTWPRRVGRNVASRDRTYRTVWSGRRGRIPQRPHPPIGAMGMARMLLSFRFINFAAFLPGRAWATPTMAMPRPSSACPCAACRCRCAMVGCPARPPLAHAR